MDAWRVGRRSDSLRRVRCRAPCGRDRTRGPQEPADSDDADAAAAPLLPGAQSSESAASAALRPRRAARRGAALAGASHLLRRDARRAVAAEAEVRELQRALSAARGRLRHLPRRPPAA
jgi:hypothetical protein